MGEYYDQRMSDFKEAQRDYENQEPDYVNDEQDPDIDPAWYFDRKGSL